MKIRTNISAIWSKKLAAVVVLLTASTLYSYATLGELGRRTSAAERPLLTTKSANKNRNFSLKSGYNFRGNQVFNLSTNNVEEVQLNTTFSYRLGNTTYSVPTTRKVAVGVTNQNKLSSATLRIRF